MTLKVGISSGIFQAIPDEQKVEYVTLDKKAQYCIYKGVQFVQIDLESVAEFKAPDLKENMKKIGDMGITFGIHSETRAFGVEVAELDSSIALDYRYGHERLEEILENSGEIGSKYLLIHSSESQPFRLLGRALQPSILVDIWGRPLKAFLEDKENEWIIEWFIGGEGKFIIVEMFGVSLEERVRRAREDHDEWYNISSGGKSAPEEQLKPIGEREKKRVSRHFLDFIESRSLHYGPERYAYYVMAKWMERNDDPLWNKIINATVEFFASEDGKTVDEWLKMKNIEKDKDGKWTIDNKEFREDYRLWVPAVSAKYIWGHFNQDKCPDGKGPYRDIKEIIKKYNMPIVLETPMAHRGVEEWLRLPNPVQMYHLVEEIGPDYIQLAMDFEHMLSIRLEPEKVIKMLPDGAGEHVMVIHAGYPAPLTPAHIPIPLGSEQQMYLYKMMYELRKKGFGKGKKDFFIVFERGGGRDPVQQSITALKLIVEYLEKDTEPDKLPKAFFGISPELPISEKRQWVNLFHHALDPIKGMLKIPEEEHTFMSRAAIEAGKRPEEWKKEEYR